MFLPVGGGNPFLNDVVNPTSVTKSVLSVLMNEQELNSDDAALVY